MVPFDFRLRTRVVFGHRSFTRLGHLAREIDFHRTLLVADRAMPPKPFGCSRKRGSRL
jgi:alcohol dehydrogenase class IV